MPHLVVEFTDNLSFDAVAMLTKLNGSLDAVGEFVSADIKSRAYALDCYLVGVADRDAAFVHVELAILAGRSPELKRDVVQRLLGIVREQIVPPPATRTQITVRMVDIEDFAYAKAFVSEGHRESHS